MNQKKARSWVFTLLDNTRVDHERLSALPCRYVVYQSQQPEKTTVHGFIMFNFQKSRSAVIKLLFPVTNLEPAYNPHLCAQHVKSFTPFIERGKPPHDPAGNGKRGKEYWDRQLAHFHAGQEDKVDPKLRKHPYYEHIKRKHLAVKKP